jgi:tetratricopeptide (TPR) repeat protein
MNVTDFTHLLNKSETFSEYQTVALKEILDAFPYFQSARALRLKGLYKENSFKYNFALKVTAAYTTDRTVLFDFITSDNFISIQKDLYEQKAQELLDIKVIDSQILKPEKKLEVKKHSVEQSIIASIKKAELHEDPQKEISQKLHIGQPLDFSANETHSFQEWLQLSRMQPIIREKEVENSVVIQEENEEKKKKTLMIDQFIQSSPKISPVKHGIPATVQIDINREDNSSLMTETLAKVYLEQKKYQKAIQAYDILILKYPEKSSFFADRISDIKLIQQNNN